MHTLHGRVLQKCPFDAINAIRNAFHARGCQYAEMVLVGLLSFRKAASRVYELSLKLLQWSRDSTDFYSNRYLRLCF